MVDYFYAVYYSPVTTIPPSAASMRSARDARPVD